MHFDNRSRFLHGFGASVLTLIVGVSTQVALAEQPSERTPRRSISAPGREARTDLRIPEPIAHYRLDGDVRDSGPRGLHGDNRETKPTSDRFGNEHGAMEFDGVNDFAVLPLNINPSKLPELTVCLWVQPVGTLEHTVIVGHDDRNFDRSIGINDKDGVRKWQINTGDTKFLEIRTDRFGGGWHFIAATYDQNGKITRLRVDDRVATQKGTCGSGWNNVRLGLNTFSTHYYRGKMDDVRFYDKALTDAQLDFIYKKQANDQ